MEGSLLLCRHHCPFAKIHTYVGHTKKKRARKMKRKSSMNKNTSCTMFVRTWVPYVSLFKKKKIIVLKRNEPVPYLLVPYGTRTVLS